MGKNSYFVIGSGPSGIAAAYALVQRGCDVVMLDGGVELESSLQKRINGLKTEPPSQWDKSLIRSFASNVSGSPKNFHKLIYGSDYPYRHVDKEIPQTSNNIGYFTPTLATGGFSNVWGAAILPACEDDITDWPISIEDLAPYYEEVLSFMPLAGRRDRLASRFPLYVNSPTYLENSSQARHLLDNLTLNRNFLRKNGIIFGSSRLAIASETTEYGTNNEQTACIRCGLCFYGCPYELIYSSRHTLKNLSQQSNFHFINNVRVEKLIDESGNVQIVAKDRSTGDDKYFVARKVFLATGVLSTARIMLSSLEAYNTSIEVKIGEYFRLPLLQQKKTSDVTKETLHSLSQVFVELTNLESSQHSVHLQIYSYNDIFRRHAENVFRFLGPLKRLFIPSLLDRLLLIQGYLDSRESSSIRLSLGLDNQTLELSGIKNIAADKIIRETVQRLMRFRKYTGVIPLNPLLHIGLPGEGRHVGSTFPMSSNPTTFQSNLLGSPSGFSNVHIVDSSVLPSLPASTITFTTMANAARIASEVYDGRR